MTCLKSIFRFIVTGRAVAFAGITMAALSLTQSASAIQWTYTLNSSPTNNSSALDFLNSGDTTYSGTFNILTAGFDPDDYTINSAIARFAFADDGDSGYEYASIQLGNPLAAFIASTEVDGNHSAPPNSYHWISAALNSTFLADLQVDGLLKFRVKRESGDFYLKRVVLEVSGDRKPPSHVPDGGATLGLLGGGLLGLLALARRLSA